MSTRHIAANGQAGTADVLERTGVPPLLGRKSLLLGMAASIGVIFANPALPSAAAATEPVSPLKWTPFTAYNLGQQVISPNNDVVSSKVAHTSSAGYFTDAAKWNLSCTYQSAIELEVGNYGSPQAAINAAQELAVPVVVKFGRGTHTLASPLTVTASDVTLDLGKATLVPTHAGRVLTFTGTSGTRLSRVGVVGGSINCNNVGAGGVSFNYCNAPFVERTTVKNGLPHNASGVGLFNCTDSLIRDFRADAVGIGIGTDGSVRTTISNCNVTAAKYGAITVYNGSHDSTVTGCTVNGYNTSANSGGGGIHIYASDRCAVTGNSVDSGLVGGTEDSSGVRFRDSHDFTCTGNAVSGLGGAGIVVITMSNIGTGAGQGTITGNTVRGVRGSGISVVLGSTGLAASLFPVVITGNTVIGVRQVDVNAGVGIRVVASADAAVIGDNYLNDLDGEGIVCGARASIVGNIIHNPGKGTLGSKSGIFVTGGVSVVSGNYCLDDQITKKMAAGLHIYLGAVVHASGNVYEGWSGAAVNNQGKQTVQVGEIASALVGFYGKAPVARPSAPPANATDLATAIALVNDLKTKLRTVGLLA